MTNAQAGTIEFSSDLANWITVEDAIDFESFDGLQPLGDQVVYVSEGRFVGTDEVLYRPELVAEVGSLQGGEFGLLAWHITDDGAERFEFVYVDRTGRPHSWTPTEFEAFDAEIESLDIIAVADDFAVLSWAPNGTEQVLLMARRTS